MKILAVEFSSEQRSVAVVQEGGGSSAALLGQAVETGLHRALGLVEEALRQARCEREDIETITVGLGPGSYTGIRGAIALAQGWQLGRDVKVIGLSSIECLAAGAEQEKIFGPVNIIVDAQRQEFYLARYEIGPGAWREVEGLRLASSAEIVALAEHGERLLGPGAAELFPSARNLYPDAAILGRLAVDGRDFVFGEMLEPIYLRETAFKKAPPSRVTS
jgi:tRNA threonylcarbamoyl adenosine modification protein YeaZ